MLYFGHLILCFVFYIRFSIHPVYSHSKSLDTRTHARNVLLVGYTHFNCSCETQEAVCALNIDFKRKSTAVKNMRDLHERTRLTFNGKNRRRQEGGQRGLEDGCEKDFTTIETRWTDRWSLLPCADIGVARVSVFFFVVHFARVPFYTSEQCGLHFYLFHQPSDSLTSTILRRYVSVRCNVLNVLQKQFSFSARNFDFYSYL